jgi:hypothetical protein
MSLKELYMIINGSSGWACVNEDNVALLHALSLPFFFESARGSEPQTRKREICATTLLKKLSSLRMSKCWLIWIVLLLIVPLNSSPVALGIY